MCITTCIKKETLNELLVLVISDGNENIIEKLIAEGVDVNFRTKYGQSVLNMAESIQNDDIIKLIIRNGAK